MTAPDLTAILDAITPHGIDGHLRFLSHELLEGRAPGTRGGRLAEEYIAAQMRRIGLDPAGEDGYLQPVPMLGLDPRPELRFTHGAGELHPAYREEYVLEAGRGDDEVTVDADLVFVGYGIRAPEYDWDDYGGVDVRGKVVLVLVNDPGRPDTPDFFDGSALTYYGRWTYKLEEAARQGAAGALLVHTEESAGYGWNVVRSSNTGEQFMLATGDDPSLAVQGWVSENLACRLLEACGPEWEKAVAAARERGFLPIETGMRVHASVHSELREVSTANVMGAWRGTDESLSNQPVLITSHHDHLGVRTTPDGDRQVHPGAYDNASGVAVLLAVAEAVAASGRRFRRPLLFIGLTAEESGLLGASWYARNPRLPLGATAGVLNIDGANLQGRTRDIAPLGTDRSDLGDHLRAAAEAEGLVVKPEAHPEQGMFFRQDHFPFARAGVPALALDHGLDYEDRPEGWGEEWYREFVSTHYHQPSDRYREGIDYGGAVQQARVLLRTAASVADADALPDWRPEGGFSRGAAG
jgi:Zn-dependent M28 family amino/carboxypeptidase